MRKSIQKMFSSLSMIMNLHTIKQHCCDSHLIVTAIDNDSVGDEASDLQLQIDSSCITTGRTAYEAFCSHFHLYEGKIKHRDFKSLKTISIAVGRNLYERLVTTYPNSTFRLYIEINTREGIVLRFHQVWPNEDPVYSDTVIAQSKSSKSFQIYLFSSANETGM